MEGREVGRGKWESSGAGTEGRKRSEMALTREEEKKEGGKFTRASKRAR